MLHQIPPRESEVPLTPADESNAATAASARRSKLLRDLSVFLLPVGVAIVAMAVVYGAVVLHSGSYAIKAGAWKVIAAMALVPVLAAMTLTAFRRTESPLSVALLVTTLFFSISVMILSSLRVPMSYTGLAATFPIIAGAIGLAGIGFHRALHHHVGFLYFPGAESIAEMLGNRVEVITDTSASPEKYDFILVDRSHHHNDTWSDFLAHCYLGGMEVMPWPRFLEKREGRVEVDLFDPSELSYGADQVIYSRLKRFFDIMAVLVTLPVTVLVTALASLWIFVRDPGPVLFVQLRRGFGGKPFRIYKLRTMYQGTAGGATHAGDDRIIPGCKLLRKLRIDELPQLLNILKGDMSLIGPRPETLDLARWYEREIPEYRFRLMVLPGITGWAQVKSGYTSNPAEAKVKLTYDLYYIKHLSFDLDLQILFRTVKTVLFGSGAR